ncbi:DUF2891 domain-containing protein [Brevibacterium aurantiacum]|uniref:DUF2891 domain-containing protein n=1 Tax=Brevibacterium aurantiacum TaxID=273384 RepID=UPI0021B2E2BF|nr:DUF2891 domain-containing protein [Brevibacterium aurantiacum]
MTSTADFVHPFAEVALANITREYLFAAHHVARRLIDIVPASEKNPAFANSFGWHSSVHMHYLLVSRLDTEPDRSADWRDEAIAEAAHRFCAEDRAWNFRQERSGHDGLSPRALRGRPHGRSPHRECTRCLVAELLVGTDTCNIGTDAG